MLESIKIVPHFLRSRIAHRPNLVRIVDNIGWLFAEKILRLGVGLFVGIWVARYLGPEQYGLLNFAMAFVAMFSVFAILGLKSIVVRDLVRYPENTALTIGTAALLQMIGALVASGAAILVIRMIRPHDPIAQILVLILAMAILFRTFATVRYWFESQVLSKYIVWVTVGVFLVTAVVKVILILMEAPLVAFAWVTFADAAIAQCLLVLVFSKVGIPLNRLRVGLVRARELLGDSWPLIIAGLATTMHMKVDMVMLGQISGDTSVGIYSAATKVSEIWYFIPMSIIASVFPAILQAKKNGEWLYYKRLQQLFDLMGIMSLTLAVFMTFMSSTVIGILFGPAFADAGPVLAVHIWAAVFVFLGVAGGRWIIAENQQILQLQRTVAGLAVNVALNLVLIPKFGAMGAAFATLLSYFLSDLFFDAFQSKTRIIFLMKVRALNPVGAFSRVSRSL